MWVSWLFALVLVVRALDSRLGGRTVWDSQFEGVGVDLADWSLAETERTILLSFSGGVAGISFSFQGRRTTTFESLTNVKNIASSTRIQT